MQPNESLYDQKPEEPVIPVVSSTKSTPPAVTPLSAPKSSSFFADFGMDSSYPKRTSSNSSKVQVSSV